MTTRFGDADSVALGVAVQRNGKIVAVGGDPSPEAAGGFLIARYRPSGRLDRGFGHNGKVEVNFKSGSAAALDVAIHRGRIIVAGGVNVGSIDRNFGVVRLRRGGSLDHSFGRDGRVTTTFPGGQAEASSLAIQPNGRIVVAGQTNTPASHAAFALARYRSNGALDRSFGSRGTAVTSFDGEDANAADVALRYNGKILAAGSALDARKFGLVQYRRNGTLDRGFGDNGRVAASIGPSFANIQGAAAVALQDGRIVTAGQSKAAFAVARFHWGGAIDRSFGGDGAVFTSFLSSGAQANAVALQSTGEIIAAGGTSTPSANGGRFALSRYRAGGALDPRFGGDGKVLTGFGQGSAAAQAVDLQPDGKLVVAGGAKAGSSPGTFALARYRTGR